MNDRKVEESLKQQVYDGIKQGRAEYEAAVAQAYRLFYTKMLVLGGLFALFMQTASGFILALLPLFMFSLDFMQYELLRRANRYLEAVKSIIVKAREEKNPPVLPLWPAVEEGETLSDLVKPHSWLVTILQTLALMAAPIGCAALLHDFTPLQSPSTGWIAIVYFVGLSVFVLCHPVHYKRRIMQAVLVIWVFVLSTYPKSSDHLPLVTTLTQRHHSAQSETVPRNITVYQDSHESK